MNGRRDIGLYGHKSKPLFQSQEDFTKAPEDLDEEEIEKLIPRDPYCLKAEAASHWQINSSYVEKARLTMTKEEIERLYPEFEKWWRKVDGVRLIKLWYEWLEALPPSREDALVMEASASSPRPFSQATDLFCSSFVLTVENPISTKYRLLGVITTQ